MDPAAARTLVRVAGMAASVDAGGPPAGVSLLQANAASIAAFRAARGGRLALPAADGGTLELDLAPDESLLPPGALGVTDASGRREAGADVTLYRGTVAGEPGSWAVVAMGGAGVFGAIERGGARWTLGPVQAVAPYAGPGQLPPHALSPEGPPKAAAFCGIDAGNEREVTVPSVFDRADALLRATVPPGGGDAPDGGTPAPGAAALVATRTSWKIAVDCDYEVYHLKFADNLTAATSYVLTVLGTVNLLYERDLEATLVVSYLNFWTTAADPYSSTSAASQLTQMQGYWGTNNAGIVRSAAFLMSGRNLGGGFALIGGLCNTSSAYAVASMDFTYTYPTATTTLDVNVVAHELGHVFGSWHTQSCNWALQGYVPAATTIDSCYASEGGCATYTNHLPPDKGTIMSYCHVFFGEANGIRLDFHPITVQRMRAIMSVAACSTQMQPQPPRTPAAGPFGNGARVTWTPGGSANVLGYEVFRSRWPLDTRPRRAGFTPSLQFDDASLGTYWYRVRTVRAADTSSWSSEVKATSPCALTSGAVTAAGLQPATGATADLNGDGREDLVLGRAGDNTMGLLFGQGAGATGNGTFTAATSLATGSQPASVAVADLTGDGILDVLFANQGDNSLRFHAGNATGGVANGTFGPATGVVTLPYALRRVVTADTDEDGIEDILAAADGTVVTLRGNGSAGVANGTFDAPVSAPVGMVSAALLLHDFDADGVLDLAVTGAAGLRVLRGSGLGGRGDGTFGLPDTYAAGTNPQQLAVADLNLDGADDLVVSDAGDTLVRVFLGQRTGGVPNGTFAAGVAHGAGPAPGALAIVDWDRNGLPDVVVANATAPGSVSVLLGRGDGTLADRLDLATGGDLPADLVATDFNEDGALDVIALNRTGGSYVRLAGSCAGVLSNAVTLLSPNGGESWFGLQERTVSWTKGVGVLSVDVQFSRDGGAHWRTIARELTGNSWRWTVPNLSTSQARLRVVAHGLPQSSDASDANFTVAPGSSLAVGGPPPALALLGARPNPARSALRVTFALPADRDGSLELVDLQGRRVAGRDLAGLGAGTHSLELLNGRTVPPGLYLVRLVSGGERRTAKVAVVR